MNDSGEEIKYNLLSSGERQLLYILIKSANACLEDTVLLMDEPEISLHLTWQEKLITTIKSINDNCQLIIVTHSPAILMKGWMDSFVDIKNISKESSND
ncbi:AAA family ATPase [Klebsiella pneumoniae]